MRTRFTVALSLLLLAIGPTAGGQPAIGCPAPLPITAPIVVVNVNGLCVDLSALVTPVIGGKGWSVTASLTLATARIDLRALFNPDPSVSFTASTTNLSAEASTFAFLFGTPVVPDFYGSALASLQMTATSPVGTTTVSNSGSYPAFLSGYGTDGGVFTNLNVDLGTTPCIASGVLGSNTCNYGSVSRTFAPAFYDNLEAFVTYRQDNIGSTLTFSGEVVLNEAETGTTPPGPITTTPEPATVTLFASGLSALIATRSRRRRVPSS